MREEKVLSLNIGDLISQKTIDVIASLGKDERSHYWVKNDKGGLDLISELNFSCH